MLRIFKLNTKTEKHIKRLYKFNQLILKKYPQ